VSDLSILGIHDDDHDDDHHSGGRRRFRRGGRGHGPGRRGGILALVLILALLAGIGFGGKILYDKVTAAADYSGLGTGSVDIQVRDGDSAGDIGATLVERGVVKSARAFVDAANADARSRSIQPGVYRLHKQMSATAALALLLEPGSSVGTRVTIPEGYTTREVFALLQKETRFRAAQFAAAARNPQALGVPAGIRSVEGFLFPATYDFAPGATPAQMLRRMVATFATRVDLSSLGVAGNSLGLSWYQVLTLASLLEEEAITEDFGKVARVVCNRLHSGMRLGLDATINYALGRPHIRLSEQETFLQTPYNTYRHAGLPPTPIANPGLAAVRAAMSPTPGSWLYFVKIDKAGHSYFTADYRDFLRAKQQAQASGVY
jgi:UPF0755 protein